MIGLIAARSKNNVIGKNGHIPWKIQGEQKQFKELTTGNVVIMGRKSYEEIGHPLPDRTTIVVSKTCNFTGENLKTARSVKAALELAKTEHPDQDIYFAGGYNIYKEALPYVEIMYITEVELTVPDGDTFFPEFDSSAFEICVGENGGDDIKYKRTLYRRRH
ncbi:MAG: dihydrofolate reductase [Treponema sp.]|nr:dihydrofolate reductase [Treponema sp.]